MLNVVEPVANAAGVAAIAIEIATEVKASRKFLLLILSYTFTVGIKVFSRSEIKNKRKKVS